ncbi:MAG: hydroxymethylbilane synthase [Lachnospiraceae bacterium]|nr:hydroxymethylbilane synthase [Lachnospiraceae bacterium]
MRELCIAGRGSRLAMAQNELVKKLLEKQGYRVRILTVSTQGDRDRKSSVTALGGNGPFVRDVEKALLLGEADIAVHCVKDLPYEMAPGLCIAGMPDAADPRDCLILRKGAGKPVLAAADTSEVVVTGKKLTIGTGSPRRTSQLRALGEQWGAEFAFKDIRGNITTRLEKLRRGEYDGIVLAKAGLDRIEADLRDFDVRVLEAEEMIPAVGQGMLACECRESDTEMRTLLDRITPPENYLRYEIERGVFCRFRCDCRSAVGIHARVGGSGAELYVMYEE